MLLDVHRSILVVIDVQGKLADMIHRPELVKAANRRLLQFAELFQVPVVLTEQYPKGLGPTHPDILADFEALTTEKRRVAKTAFGCCGDPGFEKALQEVRPGLAGAERQIVVGGIETHVCVMQTVLALLSEGAPSTSAGRRSAAAAPSTVNGPWSACSRRARSSPASSRWASNGPGTRTIPSSRP